MQNLSDVCETVKKQKSLLTYKELDLGFPFGRWFAHSIMKRDHDFVTIFGRFSGVLDSRYPPTKFSEFVHKLAEVCPLVLCPSFKMLENANKALLILDECCKMLSDLFTQFPTDPVDFQIQKFWSYYMSICENKMLAHYYEWVLRMKVAAYQVKNDARSEFIWEMIRLKYMLEKELKPTLDIIHFIINYMMHLMREKWIIFKMFKQYHYCLSACQKFLDGMPESNDVIVVQQYLHFAWVFYVGRLLDFSNRARHSSISLLPDEYCITLDSEITGPESRFVLPKEPLASEDDLTTLHKNFQILEEDLIYWGNLRICGTLDALDVLERVKEYAREMKF